MKNVFIFWPVFAVVSAHIDTTEWHSHPKHFQQCCIIFAVLFTHLRFFLLVIHCKRPAMIITMEGEEEEEKRYAQRRGGDFNNFYL